MTSDDGFSQTRVLVVVEFRANVEVGLLYLGVDHVMNADHGGRQDVVTPLAGESGVTLDYEIFNPSTPERLQGHVERTMIGRTHEGPSVMVRGDMHKGSVAILRETEPGVFELGSEVAALDPTEGGHRIWR